MRKDNEKRIKKNKGHSHAGVKEMDYYAFTSKLHGMSSGFKMGLSVGTLFLCLWLNQIWVSLLVIVTMGIFNIAGGKLSFHIYRKLMMIPIVFIFLGSIAIGVGLSPQPAGQWNLALFGWYVYVTGEGMFQAISVFFKALGGVSALYFMTLNTTIAEITGVLQRMHVPKLIVEFMYLIYRFIFILLEIHSNMRIAAKSRLGYVDLKTSCHTFGKTASNLLVLSMKKANQYYDAMLSRCYEGDLHFLEEEKELKGIWIWGMIGYWILLCLVGFFVKQ